MRIVQWNKSDQDVVDGCFAAQQAATAVDDPDGPPPDPSGFLKMLTELEGGDRKEVWFAAGDGPGTAGDGLPGTGGDGRSGTGGDGRPGTGGDGRPGTGGDGPGSVLGWYRLGLPSREDLHNGALHLCVHPGHRRRGIGAELLRHAAGRAAAHGRTLLAGWTFEGGAGDAFAKRMGARPGLLEARRVLDVTAVPPARIAELRSSAAAAATGYSLVSWTGPVPDDQLDGFAYVHEAMNDAPSDYDERHWDARRVREQVNARIELLPGRRYTIVAVHDASGQTAAFTEIEVDPELPDWGFQDNTGVARPHRGHRLGLLVKAAMLEWLAKEEPGLRKIVTWNAAVNDHMIGINERLGFEVLRPWVQDYTIPVAKLVE